ncbi:N-acylneuraminate cytidylyltransferase [Agromyces sp. 3263]|uniref:acylneuraminate cytidylyltransferase n=1 Tax=Agromyces sp. 3263 TaxID=2817750 RepID=UPI00285E6881|nr:acylneuraminate cytidylyltransferase [Agromyces sp. 3263]MDR6906813.1 N-acylneuraminate cytidylyltransferase [Agromyces sp. 3263]
MTHAELLVTPGRVARAEGADRAIRPDVVEHAADAPTAHATAVIPARGGSQGLPGKNVARVGGIPLVARAVMAALAAARIARVVVTTDDDAIAEAARVAGAEVVMRPASLAGPTASSESAVLHALEQLDAVDPVTIFIQATSPFIDPADLDAAVDQVVRGHRDAVFSAAPTHVFLWREDAAAGAVGVNHDAAQRPRRQDREPEFAETGAFYVFRTEGFRAAGHRFFGRVGVQPVHPDHAIEIDDAADLDRARALAPHVDAALAEAGRGIAGPRHPHVDVDALVTDFDGVHTDDTVMVDQLGRETVRVSRSDGHGVARLRAAGVPVLILSAEENPVVGRRAEKLGVECAQGVADKGAVLRDWAAARGIRLDRIAYLGNDRGDLPALAEVGWPVAVADAVPDVRAAARHVLERRGGEGAVRELTDLIVGARTRAGATGARDEEE